MEDQPVLKKCCFCVPLRYDLLTWGYIKLAGAILALKFYIIILVIANSLNWIVISYDDGGLYIIIGLIAVIAAEIILNLVLIIGGHNKNVKLLKVYYYYASFTWIALLIIAILFTGFVFVTLVLHPVSHSEAFLLLMYNVGFFIALIVQTFFVLSLNSEIIKLSSNSPYKIMKDESDPEGTINSVKNKEEMSLDNGTLCITEKEKSLFSMKA